MYQALYRKYRPTTFDEVIGQNIIIKTLKNAVKNSKLTHAYLFTGPRGTGKTSIAKLFGKVVNCENLIDSNPCNNCVSCTQINKKQTTDIIEIDAASNNGVDEIRELKSKVNLVPASSKYKVYIIDEVHMLTPGAFNALLKTLEEPPAHVIFVLATTEPHKIPLTILSRCQRFDFKKISENEIRSKITEIANKEKISIDESAIFEISRLSDGGMRDALSILDQLTSYADEKINIYDVHELNGTLVKEELNKIISNYIFGNISELFIDLDKYNENGKDFVKLTEELIIFLKDILISMHVDSYFNEEDQKMYKSIALRIKQTTIIKLIDILSVSLNTMKNSNSPKTILEISFIKSLEEKENDIISTIEIKNDISTIEIKELKKIVNTEKINIEPIIEIDSEKKEQIKQVKNTRINNALASFNKMELNKIKKNVEEVRSFILDHEYSKYASMIIDGIIKAYGNNYIVFIYDTEETSDYFNENIIKIEKLLNKCLKKHYKVISTFEDNWEEIKKEFNSKKQKYENIEETYNLKEILDKKNNKKDDIQNMFEDIIEYK